MQDNPKDIKEKKLLSDVNKEDTTKKTDLYDIIWKLIVGFSLILLIKLFVIKSIEQTYFKNLYNQSLINIVDFFENGAETNYINFEKFVHNCVNQVLPEILEGYFQLLTSIINMTSTIISITILQLVFYFYYQSYYDDQQQIHLNNLINQIILLILPIIYLIIYNIFCQRFFHKMYNISTESIQNKIIHSYDLNPLLSKIDFQTEIKSFKKKLNIFHSNFSIFTILCISFLTHLTQINLNNIEEIVYIYIFYFVLISKFGMLNFSIKFDSILLSQRHLILIDNLATCLQRNNTDIGPMNVMHVNQLNFTQKHPLLNSNIDVKLFQNINFTIAKNEKCLIIGENYSGKTELLKILSNINSTNKSYVTIENNKAEQFSLQELSLNDWSKLLFIDDVFLRLDDKLDLFQNFQKFIPNLNFREFQTYLSRAQLDVKELLTIKDYRCLSKDLVNKITLALVFALSDTDIFLLNIDGNVLKFLNEEELKIIFNELASCKTAMIISVKIDNIPDWLYKKYHIYRIVNKTLVPLNQSQYTENITNI